MRVKRFPVDPGPAAWRAILPPSWEYPQLDQKIIADWVIIGAGFAGLAAARRLKDLRPNDSIVILEAREVAEGPAGRNSGFMIDLPHNLSSQDYVGEASADVIQTRMNRFAIDFAENVADTYEFSPEAFIRSGKVNAAATTKGMQHNLDYASHLKELKEPFELLDEKQMQSICGSEYYQGGLYTTGTAMIQPALFVQEFAAGLAVDGVSIHENTAVFELKKQGHDWLVTTAKGSVITPKVILAVNGHVESFGYFTRRLVHIYLYASMSRVLSSSELKDLGGVQNWGFTPADAMGTTVRKISGVGGDRIIIRNQMTYNPNLDADEIKLEKFAKVHDESFATRFPQLKQVDMEYRWGGALCLSRNGSPAFGEVEEGIYSACCQNGLGTVQGTLTGLMAAELATDNTSEFLSQISGLPTPNKLPPEPLAAIGANALMRWGEFKAGREL